MNSQTKAPILLSVKFENGRADVDDALGRYMIERGLAQRKPAPLASEGVAGPSADVDLLERENAALREELDAMKTGKPLTFMQRLRRAL